jgi:hypothetical protein
LKSGRCILSIALMLFVTLCLLPGEAFGLTWLDHATSSPNGRNWIAPPTLSVQRDMGVVNSASTEWPSVWLTGIRQSWYETASNYDTASGPVPQSGGMLIVAVAASWLVTCISRRRRTTVHYRRDWTMPAYARPSLREESRLGLLRSRHDVSLDNRVGAKR